jgi:GNAT superfamily N-acetyltransferase
MGQRGSVERGHEVRRATAADRPRLARTLAAAFADDPVMTFLLPPSTPQREDRLRRLFSLDGARSERCGGAWITADGAGAAVWFAPGRWQTGWTETLREGPSWMRALGRRTVLGARVRAVMDAHHRPLPEHWYLLYLGTEPSRQGTGLGAALLRPVLEECDRTGTPAYLEATSERNRALYARHGFADREPLRLPAGGPSLFPMWREPR